MLSVYIQQTSNQLKYIKLLFNSFYNPGDVFSIKGSIETYLHILKGLIPTCDSSALSVSLIYFICIFNSTTSDWKYYTEVVED